MFRKPGFMIKTLAPILFVMELAVVFLVLFAYNVGIGMGYFCFVIAAAVSYFKNLLLYAFGQLVESAEALSQEDKNQRQEK